MVASAAVPAVVGTAMVYTVRFLVGATPYSAKVWEETFDIHRNVLGATFFDGPFK